MHATARFAPTDSFEYWYRHQDYVPTARCSRWPRSWGEYRHLRYLSPPDVAPIPQTVAQRARLENLYEAIRKRRYYDPDVYERTTKTGRGHEWYVTLIPRPVVDWFSRHSLNEIHNQIAKVVALHVIENRGRHEETIEAALERVHTSYHAAVRERVAAYEARYPALNWDGEYDDEYALDDADDCEPETAADAFF